MNTINGFPLKSEVISITKTDYPELTSAIEEAHEAMMIVAKSISNKNITEKSIRSSRIIAVYSDIVETIEAAYNLCLQGYYENSARLLRSCVEGAFTIYAFNSYPEVAFTTSGEILKLNYKNLSGLEKQKYEIAVWMDTSSKRDWRKIKLWGSIWSPFRLIDRFSDAAFKEKHKDAYHLLSQYSHPSPIGLTSRFQIREGFLKFGPVYSRKLAEPVLNDIFKAVTLAMNAVREGLAPIGVTASESSLLNNVEAKYDKLI